MRPGGAIIRQAALTLALLGAVRVALPDTARAGEEPAAAATVRMVEPRHPHLKKNSAELSDELRTPDDLSKPWLDWENATGDLGGARPWIQERGVIPEVAYTSQLFSNVDGGRKRDTRLAGNLDIALTFDSERLGLWRGGRAFFLLEHQNGRGVSKEVGALQPIGTLDQGGDYTRLQGYSYLHSFYDDRLVFKLGKSEANVGFADSVLTGQFLNGGTGSAQNIPMPNLPTPALGFGLHADPWPWLTLAAAAYGAKPVEKSFSDSGLFEGKVFSIYEVTWKPRLGDLPGYYNLGGWYSTLPTQEVTTGANPRRFDDNYGIYVLFDQFVYAEDPADPEGQGLGLWFHLSWAPPSRNQNDLWVGGGLVYTGLLPGRDEDALGFAVTSADLTITEDGKAPADAEISFEWFYGIQITSFSVLKPDLQYVVNPGGNGRNAVVLGAEWTLRF